MTGEKQVYLRPTAGKTSLSVDRWYELAKAGVDLPVVTLLSGSSMEPLIRYRRDPVTIIPLRREPLPGDIVLFRRRDGAYVVHRFFRLCSDGSVQTWGDNCEGPDAPIPRSELLGLVSCFERNGKRIATDTPEMRAKGVTGMRHFRRRRARIRAHRYLRAIGRRIRRICRLPKRFLRGRA